MRKRNRGEDTAILSPVCCLFRLHKHPPARPVVFQLRAVSPDTASGAHTALMTACQSLDSRLLPVNGFPLRAASSFTLLPISRFSVYHCLSCLIFFMLSSRLLTSLLLFFRSSLKILAARALSAGFTIQKIPRFCRGKRKIASAETEFRYKKTKRYCPVGELRCREMPLFYRQSLRYALFTSRYLSTGGRQAVSPFCVYAIRRFPVVFAFAGKLVFPFNIFACAFCRPFYGWKCCRPDYRPVFSHIRWLPPASKTA